ncbi:MAG: peptide deformylase [Atopobiaceae bacterium]|nr:peptide deformylase [Atopobiaceae bacterium]MBQ6411009.1 peptide deformylase [Atopobiaceae bacterium]MBQ6650652.1 peptide deformylase [Atopobiaceae bacterium]
MSGIDDIVLSPDPRLKQECAPITEITPEVRELAERMLEDMYAADGCGLAAPQVGELVQMVVIDVDWAGGDKNPYVLINPRIVESSDEMRTYEEGCLSFPGITVEVERPSGVVVHAENLDGDTMRYEASDNLMAVCLQHEIDHLHGVTMVDHLPLLKRVSKLREVERAIASGVRPGETSID